MNKIVSFLEAHVEKIVFVIVGLVCIWLMITRVIFSPNQVSYGDGKYSPAAIDEQVFEEAQLLRGKVSTPTESQELYQSKLTEFLALLDSSISDIDISIWPQVPYAIDESLRGTGGKYNLPRVGAVSEVAIEHIRAAAYVPTDVITPENQYDKATNEPNDIDLVTVEAKFDIEGLYNSFEQCFVDDVAEEFSDPCLAKPIFAAVQLQRQELGKDGSWSGWQNIPRSKIDHYGALFDIVEDAGSLPPGRLKVTKLQFDDWQLQMDLLQPDTYAMASAKEEWYPPLVHRKFLDIQRKEDAEEARKAREDKQTSNDRSDSRRRTSGVGGTAGRSSGRTSGRTGGRAGGGGAGGGMEGMYGGAGGGDTSRRRGRSGSSRTGGAQSYEGGGLAGSSGRRTRGRSSGRGDQTGGPGGGIEDYMMAGGLPGDRQARRGPSMFDVYDEMDKIELNFRTDLKKMKEPMAFWAHDDTVEPRKHYRYRIRLGVFNPVAGTNQLNEQDIARKNEVVLWSGFSEVTDTVEIPGRMYFFAKHIREPANVVTVQVSKYVNGYWHSEDFKVSQGELIGNVVETEIETDRQRRSQSGGYGRGGGMDPRMGAGRGMTDPMMGSYGRSDEKSVVPDSIDYSTGAVMVDAVAVNDWAGDKNLTARRYYDMLYSTDGTDIEHMPVRTSYWAKDLQSWYGKISTLENVTKEPFKAFKAGRAARPGGGVGGDDMMGGYEDMYNYDDMGGGGRY